MYLRWQMKLCRMIVWICVFACDRAGERGGNKARKHKQDRDRRETDKKLGEIWKQQTAADSVWKSNIHYVCFTGTGSQNTVGDLSQPAEEPRALPEAYNKKTFHAMWPAWDFFVSQSFAKFILLICQKGYIPVVRVLCCCCCCCCLLCYFSIRLHSFHLCWLQMRLLSTGVTLWALLKLQWTAEVWRIFRKAERCRFASCNEGNDCKFNWIIAFVYNSNIPFCHETKNSSMQLAKHAPCNYNVSGLNVACFLILWLWLKLRLSFFIVWVIM